MRYLLIPLLSVFLAVVFVPVGEAAPPVKRIAFAKAVAHWTKTAPAGVTVTCDTWTPGKSPGCRFGDLGRVTVFYRGPCTYVASVSPDRTRNLWPWKATLDICKGPRVWLKQLPLPWSPPAAARR